MKADHDGRNARMPTMPQEVSQEQHGPGGPVPTLSCNHTGSLLGDGNHQGAAESVLLLRKPHQGGISLRSETVPSGVSQTGTRPCDGGEEIPASQGHRDGGNPTEDLPGVQQTLCVDTRESTLPSGVQTGEGSQACEGEQTEGTRQEKGCIRCARTQRLVSRGCCMNCYQFYRKCIKRGETTWGLLESAGLAVPPTKRGRRRGQRNAKTVKSARCHVPKCGGVPVVNPDGQLCQACWDTIGEMIQSGETTRDALRKSGILFKKKTSLELIRDALGK